MTPHPNPRLALLFDVLPEVAPPEPTEPPTFHTGGEVQRGTTMVISTTDELRFMDVLAREAQAMRLERSSVHHPALGRIVATPEHLAGARVEEVRSEHNGGHPLTWYVLDRAHPSEGGRITVGGEDVTLEPFGPTLHGGAGCPRCGDVPVAGARCRCGHSETPRSRVLIQAAVRAWVQAYQHYAPDVVSHAEVSETLRRMGVTQVDASHCVSCGDALYLPGAVCGCGSACRLT